MAEEKGKEQKCKEGCHDESRNEKDCCERAVVKPQEDRLKKVKEQKKKNEKAFFEGSIIKRGEINKAVHNNKEAKPTDIRNNC